MSDPIILVPLDGSVQALSALPVAKALSEIEQATLHILHVGEREPEEDQLQLRARLAHGTPILDGLTVHTRVGTPPAQILHVARETKPLVIVMCKHRYASPGKLLGSTALSVLQDASCPMVLVPPERGTVPWHLHHVLVPHDGTPTTSAALRPAAELADRADAELLVAHVTDVRAAPVEPGSLTAPRYVDQPQHEWPAWSSEFLNRLACICPLGHLHVRITLARGDPATQIVRLSESQSTDLIVLAWRGRWAIPHAAIVKDILRDVRCPIMVVRVESRED